MSFFSLLREPMLRILLVDDHAVVRDGLKTMLTEQGSSAVFGEANTAEEGLVLVNESKWDALVLDISLGGKNGLEVLKEVKRIRPALPVLILSMHSEEQYARRAFRAGAAGYVTKDSAREELIKAINKVIRGRKYVSSALAELLVGDIESVTDKTLHDSLSDREFEVLILMASGKTTREIAEQLSLSSKTISTYRTRIMKKMRMRTNAELTHYAFRNALVGWKDDERV